MDSLGGEIRVYGTPGANSLAVDPVDIEFWGKAAHAGSSPELGINALDAGCSGKIARFQNKVDEIVRNEKLDDMYRETLTELQPAQSC